jgi:hypothetical protein
MFKRTWSEAGGWAAAGLGPVIASAAPKQTALIPTLRIKIFIVVSTTTQGHS